MNYAVYNIALDIHKIGTQVALSMIRGENKRKIVISLTENGRPYKITEGCKAVFTAKKPDGNSIYNDCEIDYENNLIIYHVTSQTTVVMGEVICQIELIGSDGGFLCSPTFSLIVANKLYNQEPILASSEEFNALTTYVAELQRKLANGEFKGDKGDKGDKGQDAVTDQTYNPESENAQSGIAVAQATQLLSNALKGTQSGTVIALDDVSPLEHSLDVKVESKTETVTRTVIEPYGENLLTKEIISAGELIGDYDNTLLSVSYDAEQGAVVINGTLEKDKYFVWNMENSGISNIKITNSVVGYGLSENTIEGLSVDLICWDETNENSMIVDFVGDLNVNDSGMTYTPTVFAIQGYAYSTDNDIVYDNVVIKPELYHCEYDVVTEDVPLVPDLTKVTISKYEKNLISPEMIVAVARKGGLDAIWLGEKCFWYNVYAKNSENVKVVSDIFKENTRYTFSAELSLEYTTNVSANIPMLYVYYTDGTRQSIQKTIYSNKFVKINFVTSSNKTVKSITLPSYSQGAYLYVKNMQLEMGAVETEYEEYNKKSYTPNADGTVDGVTSLYPTTTLVSDTEQVTISCKYNRDINKAFAKLEQALLNNI